MKGKKFVIIGAAKSSISVANLVLELGEQPRITDNKPLEEIEAGLKGLVNRSKIVIERDVHTKDFVLDSDLVAVSPGVRRDAKPIQWAREKDIPVLGDL